MSKIITTSFALLIIFAISTSVYSGIPDCSNKNLHLRDSSNVRKNFKIIVSLDRNYFYEGELIIMKYVITNLSDYPDSLAYLEEIPLKYIYSCVFQPSMVQIDYFRVPYTVFAPHDSIIGFVNISDYYDMKDDSIKYVRAGDCGAGIDFPVFESKAQRIKSNFVRFFVFEPVKDDILYNLLVKLYSPKLDIDVQKRIVDDFDKRIDEYYYSNYFDNVYMRISGYKSLLGYKFDNSFVNQALIIIRRFPDSDAARTACWGIFRIYESLGEKEEMKTLIKEIETSFRNTKAYYYIQEMKRTK
jgi:hypothetical protein